MKKINLKSLSVNEVLTNDQLKKITGGVGSWPNEGCQMFMCYCPGMGGDPYYACSPIEIDDLFNQYESMCGGTCALIG